jgi:cobalt-zinc-cadmium efflux system outer membrane protein
MENLFYLAKMKKLRCIFLFAFYLFLQRVSAQVLTLDSVLNAVEKQNPMLKMYDEQINAENAFAEGAKSWMPPKFSSGLWQTPYNDLQSGMLMISAEQMIPNSHKQDANQKYMLGMASVEKEGKQAQRNQLFGNAKQTYFEWVVLKRKYLTLIQIDSLLDYLLQTSRLRYTYNKEKLNNIYRAQADLYELRNMETMMVADMKMKNVMLNTLMKRPVNIVFDVDTTLKFRNYEVAASDSIAIAASRSDIKQLDATHALLKLQQNLEYSKRLPDFGVSLNHMQSLGMMPSQYSVMGMVTIPIVGWASKEYKSNVRGLNNQMSAVDYQKEALINMTTGEVVMLQLEIKSIKQQLINYHNNILPTYFKSYQAALLAYEQNTGDLFLVLDAFKMYRMQAMNEQDQLNQLLRLQVAYEKEMEIR